MDRSTMELAVRVGCDISFEPPVRTSGLFILKPSEDERARVIDQTVSYGIATPLHEFQDSHGNTICRSILMPGRNQIRHDALVAVSALPDRRRVRMSPLAIEDIPVELLRYTLPSRYCDSDKLYCMAWNLFGAIPDGIPRVQAICDWVHQNIEYRFMSGRSDLSASEVIHRRFGVCRDFAHAGISLCRACNIPARYVTGHLPDIGYVDPGSPMDFHAYFEVYIGSEWFTFDPRFNVPRIGRIKLAHGLDAVDTAFSTIYGDARLTRFQVWAYQVDLNQVSLGDPIDLSKRLDGTATVRMTHGCPTIRRSEAPNLSGQDSHPSARTISGISSEFNSR